MIDKSKIFFSFIILLSCSKQLNEDSQDIIDPDPFVWISSSENQKYISGINPDEELKKILNFINSSLSRMEHLDLENPKELYKKLWNNKLSLEDVISTLELLDFN